MDDQSKPDDACFVVHGSSVTFTKSRNKFGRVAKVLWPIKTAAALAVLGNSSERTAERWLSGEFEPPGAVLAAVLVEITKRS